MRKSEVERILKAKIPKDVWHDMKDELTVLSKSFIDVRIKLDTKIMEYKKANCGVAVEGGRIWVQKELF